MTRGTYQAVALGDDRRPCNGTVIASGPTMESLMHLWKPGSVVIAWQADHEPVRRLPPASLAAVRRKRLRRRLETKHPLFADLFEQAELAARPAFYAGARDQLDKEPTT